MNHAERNLLIATIGLAVTALGAFLPWARIGGRSRSGFSTADTFIALAQGALPDAIAWVGRWWYLPAFLTFLAWASTFAHGHWVIRTTGISFVALAAAMWWLFLWAGAHYNVLQTRAIGPIVATAGMVVLAYACGRRRLSPLQRPEPVNTTGPPAEATGHGS